MATMPAFNRALLELIELHHPEAFGAPPPLLRNRLLAHLANKT
jgi:hypothetical protein